MKLNKIYCGDCLEIMKDIPDGSVDMILTDIPYDEVNKKKQSTLRNINKGLADIKTFELDVFIIECVRITKGSIYIFCGFLQISELQKLLQKNGLSTRLGIYKKNNPSPMNGDKIWLNNIEPCVFGRKANATFNQHCKGTVWEYNSGRSKIHPTEKPLALFQYLIRSSSKKNDLILDPCVGSGTTAVAALAEGRNFIGIEKDKTYFETANKRLKYNAQLSLFQGAL